MNLQAQVQTLVKIQPGTSTTTATNPSGSNMQRHMSPIDGSHVVRSKPAQAASNSTQRNVVAVFCRLPPGLDCASGRAEVLLGALLDWR